MEQSKVTPTPEQVEHWSGARGDADDAVATRSVVSTGKAIISKLATKAILCTWEFNPRTQKVIGIIPHYMAAHWTAEQCATYFRDNGLENSANYCIGYDGSCVCNVTEDNRAWTSSSSWADQRCITVEIANNAPSSEIPAPALEKFKQLATDIALRYGINAYSYTGDTSGNFMLHRFFAATPCPGDWFVAHIPEIVKDINARIKSGTIYGKDDPMFIDYDNGKYKKEVEALADLGIFSGFKTKKGLELRPTKKVTRVTVLVWIYRALKVCGKIK